LPEEVSLSEFGAGISLKHLQETWGIGGLLRATDDPDGITPIFHADRGFKLLSAGLEDYTLVWAIARPQPWITSDEQMQFGKWLLARGEPGLWEIIQEFEHDLQGEGIKPILRMADDESLILERLEAGSGEVSQIGRLRIGADGSENAQDGDSHTIKKSLPTSPTPGDLDSLIGTLIENRAEGVGLWGVAARGSHLFSCGDGEYAVTMLNQGSGISYLTWVVSKHLEEGWEIVSTDGPYVQPHWPNAGVYIAEQDGLRVTAFGEEGQIVVLHECE
jgi:hypothetical protein